MKKTYTKPVVQSEKLEFGVFGRYHIVSNGRPGNNGIGNAFGFPGNDPNKFGNNGKDHDFHWPFGRHKNP